jgi:S-adenosylmethionine:diacylglycerol 3-amino-3-carboxypropyl transferase
VATSTVPETPWEAGRFDAAPGKKKILFGRMYEDPEIELAAFHAGGRIFCIASAGCTAMRLAAGHEVVAVDINPVQLAYTRERLAGAPMQMGSAERMMRRARRLLPLAGWTKRKLHAFLDLADPAAQLEAWRRNLDTRLFRIGFDAALSLRGLAAVYASPFLEVLPRHFGRVMRARMERCFAAHPNRTNPYARALLLGELSGEGADQNARPIELVCADAAEYLEGCAQGRFHGFALSNILDGASDGYRARLFAAVARAAAPGARVVLRSIAEPAEPLPENLTARDRSMLWGIVTATPAERLAVQRS